MSGAERSRGRGDDLAEGEPRARGTRAGVIDRLVRALVRTSVVLGIVAAFVVVLAPASTITRFFSRGWFPVVQPFLVGLSGSVPWSWSLCVIAVAAILGPVFVVRRVRRARAAGVGWPRLARTAARRTAVVVLVLWAVFAWVWGLGYRQTPIERRYGFADAGGGVAVSEDQAWSFTTMLIATLHETAAARRALGDEIPIDAERAAIAAAAERLQRFVAAHEGWRPAMPRHVKYPPTGLLLSFDVSGVCSPWLLEAHVATGLPAVARISVAIHELAHLAGYNGEADAEFVKLAVGLDCDDPLVRYAAAVSGVYRALIELRATSSIARLLPPVALADLELAQQAVATHKIDAVADTSWAAYDLYLQSQGVEHGVGDYARAFELWVAAWREGRLIGGG